MAIYKRVSGVEYSEWGDGDEPADQARAKLEEMYHDEATGEIVLTFIDRDDDRSWHISIPVKATSSWNGFVESLPTWVNK